MSASTVSTLSAPRFQFLLSGRWEEFLAGADMLGRLHVLLDAKEAAGIGPKLNTLSVRPAASFTEVLGFESVPFVRAIERIRNLTGMTKLAFDGLKAQYRQQAFTISGISDVALIDRVRRALTGVLESGGTREDFHKAVDALTTEAGAEDLAQAQINTVFQTNFQTAYSNGRFEQMRDPAVTAVLPFWKYWTAGDARVRPAHAALDGFVARFDDPVWRQIYPPSGYNCRCTVTAIGADEAPDDAGQPGTDRLPAEAAANVPDPGWGGRAWG